jgi:hypothetical protein
MVDRNSYRWADLSNQEETLMRKWTEDDKATLEAFARAGVPDHIVGKRIGRSTSSVISQRLKQGIRRGSPRFSWTPDATLKLRQLWDDGLPAKDIAENLYCGYKAVKTKARALDLKPRKAARKGCPSCGATDPDAPCPVPRCPTGGYQLFLKNRSADHF